MSGDVIAATGHRPPKIGGYSRPARIAVTRLARTALQELRPSRVITGMAQGWDQAVALACIIEAIPFTAAVPFEGQENLWPEAAQQRYRRLLERADEVHVICAYPGARAMQRRNEWMVDHADRILALWDRSITGGTANCIVYAEKSRKPILNLWDRWSA